MADDLKLKIKMEVDDGLDTSKIKKTAEKAGEDIGENVNKGMTSSIAKGVAIWDAIKGAISKVWNATKQFLSDSINLANSYESAFAGVRKTVDGTEKEFIKLDTSLKNLAKEIPVTYQELAGIMELGGQLGVETKNLDKFTKTIAELGTATNLTSESAAQMLAQFANITKMDLNDIDRLGAVIVDLGNNFATTEADIVNFSQRIAGAGQIAGISQANIMAISTAFASVGIEAEAGGTAVQKVLLDMNSAVTMGGDQLKKYATIVGMTTDEFKQLYNEHPEQVFIKFIESLQGAGQEAQALLDALGLNDQRLVRGFLSLSQNADLLTDAIERSNTAWEENIALSNEAEQRFSTTESQIIMQQNERANMMAEIGEKMQDVVLWWEQAKTSFVNAIGSFMGVTQESNEATEELKAQIEEVVGAMNKLDQQLENGEITLQERAQRNLELKKQEEEKQKALREEEKRLEELGDKMDDVRDKMKMYQDQYERNLKLYGEEDTLTKDSLKNYEKREKQLERLQIVQEAGVRLTDEEIDKRIKQKEYTKQLTEAENNLKIAKDEYNKLKSDDSSTRAELEASRQKVAQLTAEYNKLKEAMASVGIAKSLKGILNRGNESRAKINSQLNEQFKNIQGSNGTGGILGDLTLGGSGGGKSKSKADEMLKEFDDDLVSTRKDLDKMVQEHQKNYDDLTKKIEKVEEEYGKLQGKAEDTWESAEKSLKSYNEQLEKNQTDAITNLGQRYVELKKDLIDVDSYMKKIAEDLSRNELDRMQESGTSEYNGYKLKDIIELKEKLDEMKLIEENTTEEQRKSTEFTRETSKAQEILNSLKEKELELEEKKAIAIEKQKIATAVMNQEMGKELVQHLVKQNGEDMGYRYYDIETKKREQIHDVDNIEYAKQLEEQFNELNKQKEQLETEKNDELTIIQDTTTQKINLENTYQKVYEENSKAREKLLDNLIAKTQRLIELQREYLSMGGTLHNAYGGSVLQGKASIVGENGPETIIARQSSYVQPRNAGNTYSTVNNSNSLSINGLEFGNFATVDDMLDALKEKLTYRS